MQRDVRSSDSFVYNIDKRRMIPDMLYVHVKNMLVQQQVNTPSLIPGIAYLVRAIELSRNRYEHNVGATKASHAAVQDQRTPIPTSSSSTATKLYSLILNQATFWGLVLLPKASLGLVIEELFFLFLEI